MNWSDRTHLTKIIHACNDDITNKQKMSASFEIMHTLDKKVKNTLNQCKGERKKGWYSLFFSALKQKVLFPAWIPITPSQQREDRKKERKWKTRHSKRQSENLVVEQKQIVLSESCLTPRYIRGENRIGRKIRKKTGKIDRMKQWSTIANK